MNEAGGANTRGPTAADTGGQTSPENARGPKVHTSFRINPIVELFSRMKGEKERMLKEIGLHGLTNLPKEEPTTNRSFNWQFAFWLLQRVDSETGVIDLGVRGRLDMRCEDVELVIGIPCSGAELKKSNPLMIQETKQKIKQGLLLDDGDDLTLDNIRKVLEREIPTETDGGHRRSFIMAAFIFAVSFFLAPKGRPAKVNTDILECILDTGNLKNINWALYVLLSIREASAKLNREVMAKTKSVTLDGCLLLLQVIYLDNLDFGLSSTRHDIIPRVKDFSFDKLNELISADRKSVRGARVPQFGVRKLRGDQDTLYTRGDLYRSLLLSKHRVAGGLFLESDKEQILEYVRRNIDEAKRKIKIASRKFEEDATNTLDQCNLNISTMLDVCLTGRMISVGRSTVTNNVASDVRGREGKGIDFNGTRASANGNRGRYKTMTRRPSKVRRVETINNASDEN